MILLYQAIIIEEISSRFKPFRVKMFQPKNISHRILLQYTQMKQNVYHKIKLKVNNKNNIITCNLISYSKIPRLFTLDLKFLHM